MPGKRSGIGLIAAAEPLRGKNDPEREAAGPITRIHEESPGGGNSSVKVGGGEDRSAREGGVLHLNGRNRARTCDLGYVTAAL